MMGRMRSWEAKLGGWKKNGCEVVKEVQDWGEQSELVHLTEDGKKSARSGCRRDQC